MVGLSVILENCKDLCESGGHQIISKGSMIKSSSPSPTSPRSPSVFSRSENLANFSSVCGFLEICFLCKQKLLPGKDIYMYKGDKAFCSVECRYKQIYMDEEESSGKSGCTMEYNCSMAATSSPSSTSSPSGSGKKGGRNAFAF
ncbi:hypothetical protein ACS0TY_027841 [Phlomoides rotata]